MSYTVLQLHYSLIDHFLSCCDQINLDGSETMNDNMGAGHLFQKSIDIWPELMPAQTIQCGVTGHLEVNRLLEAALQELLFELFYRENVFQF